MDLVGTPHPIINITNELWCTCTVFIISIKSELTKLYLVFFYIYFLKILFEQINFPKCTKLTLIRSYKLVLRFGKSSCKKLKLSIFIYMYTCCTYLYIYTFIKYTWGLTWHFTGIKRHLYKTKNTVLLFDFFERLGYCKA